MRFTTLALSTALFGLAFSQVATLPSCAQGCVTQFTTGSTIGNCPSLNITCICSSQTFLSDIACCLANVCSASDQNSAVVYAKQICTTAGVTVPNAVVCNNSTSATSGTASSVASSASSVAVSMTSAGSGSPTATTATSASGSPSSVSKAGGFQNAPGTGISFVGGLLAALVLL